MEAAGGADAAKAGQPVGKHGATGAGEARHWRQFDSAGVSLVVHRDRRHERYLVFRATSGLTASALAATEDVVYLHCARQPVKVFALGHGLHQLVVDQPGCRVADAQMPLQGQGRRSGLGLADQINGQEPDRQGQVGLLEQGAGDQRSLPVACAALEGHARIAGQQAMGAVATSGAAKPRRPAALHQGRRTLLNGAMKRFKGKGGSEQTLLRTLLDTFEAGDRVRGDAFYGTCFLLPEPQPRHLDALFEQHGARSAPPTLVRSISWAARITDHSD